ncbi:MAG: signal transduction histidine kinase [Mycobacterium sp.]|jgi:signal transduction histidine kinase|nr:signal transduction histidine kinase [Mycobacterium sp.]
MTGKPTRTRVPSLRQLIWLCIFALTAVFIASTLVSILGRLAVAHAVSELNGHMLPVQNTVAQLNKAYVDQETGQRGFMLTGDRLALQPYIGGTTSADRLLGELRANLAGDTQATQVLDGVAHAADTWTSRAAQPQIQARRNGAIAPDELKAMTLTAKTLFDQLRIRLGALDDRTDQLIAQQIERVRTAQRVANIAHITAAAVLAVVVVCSIVVVQRLLTRPVNRLLGDVRTVAEGDYDQPIRQGGPAEIAALADATETMRDNLRTSATRLADAERRDEQARMAADLQDRIIQRVFGLGLGLTSAASRRSPDLKPFISETDGIIHDLRRVIFDLDKATSGSPGAGRLRTAIIDSAENSVGALGFTPAIDFDGPIDEWGSKPGLPAAVLAVLQESLINVARHAKATEATVRVVASGEQFCLSVQDNGIGVLPTDQEGQGRRNIRSRAERLGGQATVRRAGPDGGTIVEWKVPI